MSVTGEFYKYSEGRLEAVDIALADTLSVADSYLVSSGMARAVLRHFERFANSIVDDQVTTSQLPEFFSAVLENTPDSEDWFPRLEYRSSQPLGQRLFLRMRPAPERTESCTLWTLDEPDSRVSPVIKGPDLSLCQKFRRVANMHGADEAVLVDAQGFIADGALSSIVWWRDDVLCAPDDRTQWLPSITRELIFELASQAGYASREEHVKPEDLSGCEVWSLSALQGIRAVVSWGDIPLAIPRLNKPFAKRLALLVEPLPAPESLSSRFSAELD